MPILIRMRYDGRRDLCFSNFRSTNGDSVRLSIKTKIVSETTAMPKRQGICNSLIEAEEAMRLLILIGLVQLETR